MEQAKLILNNKEYSLPVFEGTEGEVAIDITKLRDQSGAITYDPGYGNTGSCKSAVTFIDGDKGILHYRGYPIEDLAEKSSFIEVAYLLIYGKLPTQTELDGFKQQLTQHSLLNDDMRKMSKDELNMLLGYLQNGAPQEVIKLNELMSVSKRYPSAFSDHPCNYNCTDSTGRTYSSALPCGSKEGTTEAGY